MEICRPLLVLYYLHCCHKTNLYCVSSILFALLSTLCMYGALQVNLTANISGLPTLS